ncbi:MAG: HD domain-containing protein [Planctomycetota bacterium]|nr:HD domain-containing protein [Planctomycetota bacterium]
MISRILYVDGDAAVRESFRSWFGAEHEIWLAATPEEALVAIRDGRSFAVIVSAQELPRIDGIELLARARIESPESVTVLAACHADVSTIATALRRAHVFQLVASPFSRDSFGPVLAECVTEHRRLVAEHEATRALNVSRARLSSLTDSLERRIHEQSRALLRMRRFAEELGRTSTLGAVAELAAFATREICDVSGARVEYAITPDHCGARGAQSGQLPEDGLLYQPLPSGDRELGTLIVPAIDVTGQPLGAEKVELLVSIAGATAFAAGNCLGRCENRIAHDETILAMAKVAEQRDNETGLHVERVSQYCRLAAEALRARGLYLRTLTDEWIGALVKSAPLHDVGKVGIPDSILLKPGRLNDAEWKVMRTHAEIGAQTLRAILAGGGDHPFLAMGLDIAWCHHERWDGKGYPRGLAGEQIPLAARIVSVADVYDALTSVRPYKRPWSHEEALAYLGEQSGRHFDPSVVAAFVDSRDEVGRIRSTLADPGHKAVESTLADEQRAAS